MTKTITSNNKLLLPIDNNKCNKILPTITSTQLKYLCTNALQIDLLNANC